MNLRTSSSICQTVLTVVAITFSLAVRAQAQTETLLFSFGDNSGGYGPITLASNGSGNFYGIGGIGNGMVYKMTPSSSGWKEAMIHSFTGGADGSGPSSSAIFDAAGNLYGTTVFGGKSSACPTSGCSGVVYELSPTTSGSWKLTVLHTFSGGIQGASPIGIVFDAAGNIYGMTQTGGNTTGACAADSGCGTVFRLSPKSGGGWQFNTVHTFSGEDGLLPQGNLLTDAAGNIYGSTSWGGNPAHCMQYGLGGCGVVFRLSPTSEGGYQLTALHRFLNFNDGANPGSALVFDAAGNLYGSTGLGESNDANGVAFELSPTASGLWTFLPLYNFNNIADGGATQGGLIIDGAGNLYGSSSYGGTDSSCNCGTVFELSPGTSGWTFYLLHSFTGFSSDGLGPIGNLVLDSSGNLFGITSSGGAYDGGSFYEITP